MHRLPILDPGPLRDQLAHAPARPEVSTIPSAEAQGEGDVEALLQVGELARETGKTVRALHLYEELGLLTPHARSKGKFRLYGNDALVRVRWITKLQGMGLSLAEITQLARGWAESNTAPSAMDKMRRVFEVQLQQTREQLGRLHALEDELEASLRYLDVCGESCDSARVVSQCTRCDLHDCDDPPELVLGVRAQGSASRGDISNPSSDDSRG